MPALAILGLGLILVGLGFKVVVSPFQIYAPDVYEGAPTPVTALLASGPKVATFAIMIRIFYVSFASAQGYWFWAICVFRECATMFIGNLAALVQTNVKRMLAYSSIAHAGYILVAFAASDRTWALPPVLFYLAAYMLMKVGAVRHREIPTCGQQDEKRLSIQDYSGLASKQPVVAACFSLIHCSHRCSGLARHRRLLLGKFFAFQAALGVGRREKWLVAARRHRGHQQRDRRLLLLARDHLHVFPGAAQVDYTPTPVHRARRPGFALFIAAAGTLYLGILPSRVSGSSPRPPPNLSSRANAAFKGSIKSVTSSRGTAIRIATRQRLMVPGAGEKRLPAPKQPPIFR